METWIGNPCFLSSPFNLPYLLASPNVQFLLIFCPLSLCICGLESVVSHVLEYAVFCCCCYNFSEGRWFLIVHCFSSLLYGMYALPWLCSRILLVIHLEKGNVSLIWSSLHVYSCWTSWNGSKSSYCCSWLWRMIFNHEHCCALIEYSVGGFVCKQFWECKGYYHIHVYSGKVRYGENSVELRQAARLWIFTKITLLPKNYLWLFLCMSKSYLNC